MEDAQEASAADRPQRHDQQPITVELTVDGDTFRFDGPSHDMLVTFRAWLEAVVSAREGSATQIGTILEGVTNIMATLAQLQEKLDVITTGFDGIAADIAALKAQVQAGADTDVVLAALDALAARVTTLDAQTP